MQEEVFSPPFTSRTSLVCNQVRKIALYKGTTTEQDTKKSRLTGL